MPLKDKGHAFLFRPYRLEQKQTPNEIPDFALEGRRFLNGLRVKIVFKVVALLFYVQGKHLRSCRDGQLT